MKYQTKLKREIAELYQSNDPLRWVYMANKFGVDRRMSRREFKIFKRRMFATFKRMGVAMETAVKNITGAMVSAAQSMANLVTAMTGIKNGGLNDITVHRLPATETTHMRIAPSIGGLATAPIIPIHDLKITVDEAMHLDDETMKTVEKAVELGKTNDSK